MADAAEKEKPNLKICIDNTESDSEDEDSLVQTDASDVGEGETDQDGDNEPVEFNVRIGKTQPPSALTTTTKQVAESKFKSQIKKYENKAGEFVVGLDLTDEQLLEKREERAKRFGIPPKKANKLNVEELHQSLGVTTEKADERGVRPEVIHMRGLDDMNTQNVFKYFQEFSPGSIEWIDDSSCNVVWMDKSTACRALMKLSRSQQCIEKYIKKNQVKNGKKIEDKDEKDRKNQELKIISPAVEEESDESDSDELDLTEEPGSKTEKQTVTPMDTTETETTDQEKTENITADETIEDTKTEEKEEKKGDREEDMEEGEISSDSDSDVDSDVSVLYKDINLSRVIWPPGQWRLGVPSHKSKYLFFRYATKADIKVRGAEKRSQYYVKHGNPNYGGMKGLISNSRKRQHWSRRRKEDEEEEDGSEGRKFDVKIPKGRELPDYSDVGMFAGERSIDEKESFDRRPSRPVTAAYGSEGEESDETEDEGLTNEKLSRPALFTKGFSRPHKDRFSPLSQDRLSPLNNESEALDRGLSEDESDSNTTELELQKLLAVPRRSGRMYADDVEEEIKAKVEKRSTDPNDLTVVTDVRDRLSKRHQESSSSGDARQLITGKGLDLRRRLEIKRQKHIKKSSDMDSPDYHSLQIKVFD